LSELELDLELALAFQVDGNACLLLVLPYSDRSQEGLEVFIQVFIGNSQVPVEKEEELLLHEVDFAVGEAKVLEARHIGVTSPVLVLW